MSCLLLSAFLPFTALVFFSILPFRLVRDAMYAATEARGVLRAPSYLCSMATQEHSTRAGLFGDGGRYMYGGVRGGRRAAESQVSPLRFGPFPLLPLLLQQHRRRRPGAALYVRAPDADDARARGCEARV
ncbi:hypothetical protein FB451DRAFT_1250711 [Mycena latifolia]|nr:hypothetical protein FB451DRAFT_1250711 [Mycena latifolia]